MRGQGDGLRMGVARYGHGGDMQEGSEGHQPLTLSEETVGGFGSGEVGQCDRSSVSTGPFSSPRLRARSKGTVCLCYLPSLPHTLPSTL